jgi:HAAS domain-containing protein
MTGLTTVPREVEEYLAAVRDALADLPAAERDDLLSEVEASLADAAAESGGALAARLGEPATFAAELRSAAGLHEAPRPERQPSAAGQRARAVLARFADDPRVGSARRLGHELAPLWWAARGYLVVGGLASAFDAAWSTRYPVVPVISGTAAFGLAIVALAVVASVAVGLWQRRTGAFPRLSALVNVAVLLLVIPVAQAVTNTSGYDRLVAMAYTSPPESAAPTPGLAYDGLPVDNVYPFSRDGRLLHDVPLYDGRGRPLDIPGDRLPDSDRRFVVTNGNKPLFNVFPIRYYEPGTRRVARPNAAPYVELPLVRTPPLPRRAR